MTVFVISNSINNIEHVCSKNCRDTFDIADILSVKRELCVQTRGLSTTRTVSTSVNSHYKQELSVKRTKLT